MHLQLDPSFTAATSELTTLNQNPPRSPQSGRNLPTRREEPRDPLRPISPVLNQEAQEEEEIQGNFQITYTD